MTISYLLPNLNPPKIDLITFWGELNHPTIFRFNMTTNFMTFPVFDRTNFRSTTFTFFWRGTLFCSFENFHLSKKQQQLLLHLTMLTATKAQKNTKNKKLFTIELNNFERDMYSHTKWIIKFILL